MDDRNKKIDEVKKNENGDIISPVSLINKTTLCLK